jgi:BlaI family transcriptional regulator, penicillinase repressor
MGRKSKDVTDAELAVLEALWQRSRATVRELAAGRYPRAGSAQHATVLKLLERLERKGFVRRDRNGPAHVFEAAIARDDLIGRRLEAVAESLCRGSRLPLLMHLVDPRRLTADEVRVLRELVEQFDGDSRCAP